MNKVPEFAVEAKTAECATTEAIRGERGTANVEYGVLVALIAAIAIGSLQVLDVQIQGALRRGHAGAPVPTARCGQTTSLPARAAVSQLQDQQS